MKARASVVIPAHDEARSIDRLLRALLADAAPGELEIVVVCNGCTDDTAQVARAAAPDARVEEIPEPSKYDAMRRGDAVATVVPRIYVDADLELDTAAVRRLAAAVDVPTAMAAAPERDLRYDGSSAVVRSYYRVWRRLPQVRDGVFGRGVIAVSGAGLDRVRALPPAMSDDLAISEAFAPHERLVVAAPVVIRTPRTVGDLVRRRVRVATGVAQLQVRGAVRPESRTQVSTLVDLVRAEPRRLPDAAVFAAVTAVARARARSRVRRQDFTTWDRDESSRA